MTRTSELWIDIPPRRGTFIGLDATFAAVTSMSSGPAGSRSGERVARVGRGSRGAARGGRDEVKDRDRARTAA